MISTPQTRLSFCPGKIFAALYEARQFSWRRLLHPAQAGCWPLVPRVVFLLVFSVLAGIVMLTVSATVMPGLSEREHAAIGSLQQRIHAQRAHNVAEAARVMSRQRHHWMLYPLLQMAESETVDIARAMEYVSAAAAGSDVKLLTLSPETESDDGWFVMQMKASLLLPSFSRFWLILADAPAHFRVHRIRLSQAVAPEQFDLVMELSVRAVTGLAQRSSGALQSVASDNALQLARPKTKALRKGFLFRTGSPEILFLIRDESGRLTRVEEHINSWLQSSGAERGYQANRR